MGTAVLLETAALTALYLGWFAGVLWGLGR